MLSKSQILLLTLIKLRLGLHFKDLDFRFGASEPVASKPSFKCVEAMYGRIRNFITKPSKKEMAHTMPAAFRKSSEQKYPDVL